MMAHLDEKMRSMFTHLQNCSFGSKDFSSMLCVSFNCSVTERWTGVADDLIDQIKHKEDDDCKERSMRTSYWFSTNIYCIVSCFAVLCERLSLSLWVYKSIIGVDEGLIEGARHLWLQ